MSEQSDEVVPGKHPARIYLSPPHLSGKELTLLQDALQSNWIAPLGPHVDAFEQEFAEVVQAGYALAVASGTAALHLALLLAGVEAGDEVMVSTLTFAGSVFPIRYLNARPVFVDSETISWNLDPALLCDELEARARTNRLPKALVLVHLFGQCADIDPVLQACRQHGVALIEDAAEALGAAYKGRPPGAFGDSGIFSFNGNKIVTTSGGGMLVSNDRKRIERARKLASQARVSAPHYEHEEIGYNYRMSNLCAAVGRAQLSVLEERVAARRANFEFYRRRLGHLPGLSFMPEAAWGLHTRWLTVARIDPQRFGRSREQVRLALEKEDIEARPVWKPMHMQPVFSEFPVVGGRVAESLFADGLCLPSGSNMSRDQLERVADLIESIHVESVYKGVLR